VVVRLESGGVVRDVAYLDRGAIFGEFAALGSPVRLATVVARTELQVIRFPGSVVAALLERFPRFAKLLGALASARQQPG
jgi:CRP-like cAMP-binding protein